ncbi:beta-lactamase/transpeptidase-like protein [Elsinoe ampelina]|uniref:Beta-lactamase/transpeptidase-like protein n=1 Tax=Elsinoe ampelina TaxID=302913 RepID=A0A6A6GFV6_9PEZI|nr:beta-lactamase/transpeptidase-like protein [Elsinoe ampelina]
MHLALLVLASLVSSSLQGCPKPSPFFEGQQIPLSASDAHCEDKYDPFTAGFDEHVEGVLEKWNTPGLAGYGFADVESKTPVTPYTLFQCASTTKSFIASLVAIVVQDQDTYKDINWEFPLHNIQPRDFVLTTPYESAEVTFLDALSHRTGVPRHDFSWIINAIDIQHQTQILRHLPPSAPFRTKWQYCNLMYTATTNALQVLTGKPIEQILRKWLLQPLGLQHTYTGVDEAKACKALEPTCIHASQYAWTNKTAGYVEFPLDVLPAFNGAGGITSNVHDYAIWTRTLMNKAGPVSTEGHDTIRQPLSWPSYDSGEPFDGATFYGLGTFGSTYRGHRVFYHNGAIGGFFSRWTYFPDLQWGFSIMQNAPNYALDVVGWKLIMDFLDVPEADRKDMNEHFWTSVHKAMDATLQEPKKLYPNVPSPPILPSLAPNEYIGTYQHPGYGNITLHLGYPDDHRVRRQWLDTPTTVVMHLKSDLLGAVAIFHHVSGDHWLVEEKSVDNFNFEVPTRFIKAKTSIGPDGKVESIFITIEPEVKGDKGWAKFVKLT